MSDLLFDQQAAPTAPAAGTGIGYFDSISKLWTARTSIAPVTVGGIRNASVAAQAYTTTEVYVAGSAITIPSHLLQVGARFRWRVVCTKTAGTGTPIWKLYKGTLGTTGDTAIATLTQVSVPTSVTDTGIWDIEAVLRNAGAAGIMLFSLAMTHVLQNTGFSLLPANVQQVASSSFDTTAAGLIIGISANFGTAGAGNIEQVTSEMVNS